MWKRLKSYFSKTKTEIGNPVSVDFAQKVRQAIFLFEKSDDLNTDEDVVSCLTKNGIENHEAIEILLFLPVAFVRQWLPAVR